MKNFFKLLLVAAVLLALSGCTKKMTEQANLKIYCTNSEGTKLVEENYKASSANPEEMIREMLDKLKAEPSPMEHSSPIPGDVHIVGYQLEGKQLTLTFDEAYQKMDNVTEVLMRAAVVKTLVQIEGVDDVVFKIGGQDLLDETGNPIGAMNADSFIDTKGKGINSYQYASLTLYFANEDGTRLVKEMRNVHYSTNTTLEKVVLEQLIAGPVNTKLQPVLPANTKVSNVLVDKDSCTVNFDESFSKILLDRAITPEVTIYAMVNSMIDTCKISKVQMQIGSNSEVLYRDKISFKAPFERSKDIIMQVEGTATENVPSDSQADTNMAGTEDDSNIHEPSMGIDPNLKQETDTAKESDK